MPDEVRPDMSCVPFRRKGAYLALTVPFLALLAAVFAHLWTFSLGLALVFAGFYLAMCCFQAYCCAYQDCPYAGGFCPAVAGIIPASSLARFIYGRREIGRSRRAFRAHAVLAIGGWLGLIVFPLRWLTRLGICYVVGYVACHGIYYLAFALIVCPVCAIRETCPGGGLQKIVRGGQPRLVRGRGKGGNHDWEKR